MTEPQCLDALAPVEARFKHKYGEREEKLLYRRFKSLSKPQFRKLCDFMIVAGGGFLPSVEAWSKMHGAHQRDFDITRKVHVSCSACKGTGVRMFLHRREENHGVQYGTPPARCSCDNGLNYPNFPTIAEAEDTAGFEHWLNPTGSLFDAITTANKGEEKRKEAVVVEELPDKDIPF